MQYGSHLTVLVMHWVETNQVFMSSNLKRGRSKGMWLEMRNRGSDYRVTIASAAILLVVGCTTAVVGSVSPGGGSTSGGGNPSSKSPVAVTINPSTIVLNEQNQQQMGATVQYSDGTFDSNVKWSSSDGTILIVNSTTGMMTALKPGVASIVAVSGVDSSKQAQSTVTVKAAPVTDAFVVVTPSAATIAAKSTIQLSAYIQNSAGQVGTNITWSSSNQAVASVTNGLVTGVATGSATITAASQQDPSKSAACTISVN